MGWRSVEELPDVGEVVIRLRNGNPRLPIGFLGGSVHQIAMIAGGAVICLGTAINRDCIEGWVPLPPPNRENQ